MQTPPHFGRVSRRQLLQAVAAGFSLLPASGQHASGELRFRNAEGGGFDFQTGLLAGKLRASGQSTGFRPMVHVPSGADMTSSMGLAGHYRVFTTNHRYGGGAWYWPSEASLREDGAVEVHWPSAADRQFEMWAVYRWAQPATLDVETRVHAAVDLPGFESFLAFYFSERFNSSMALVKDAGGEPGFAVATAAEGTWQMFPRDARAVALIQDGRWNIPPNPVNWNIRSTLANPIALRRDEQSGLTAIIMAPSEDCFAIAMPHQTDSHYSVYLSLFGCAVEAGGTARARTRMVITQAMRDSEIIDRLYRPYLDQLR